MLESFINEQTGTVLKDGKLVASKHLKAGSTILVQPPLASVPLPAKRHQRCNYCLQKAQLQCCSRCRSAYFCNNECFHNAWVHFHRILCEPQETDIYKDVDADRWLLERTALTLHSHARLNKQQSHSPLHLPASIDALNQHTPIISAQPADLKTVQDVATCLESSDCKISLDELSVLWKRIKLCSFPILDPEHRMEQTAVGVYPITSLYINHSCRPNAAIVYRQDTQSILTLEDILPDEPITITYIDLINTKEGRTKLLQDRFGPDYKCFCTRCEGELAIIDTALEKGESLGMTLEQGYQSVSKHLKTWSILELMKTAEKTDTDSWSPIRVLEVPQFAHFVSRISAPDIYYASINDKKPKKDTANSTYKSYMKEDQANFLQRIPAAMTALLNVPETPAFTLASIRAAEKLLAEKISEDSWVQASRCALYLFVIYRLMYPPFHPVLAYHTLILAKSGWNALVEMELVGIGKKMEKIYANGVRTWIELAKNAIDVTFGRKSSLWWKDFIELQWVYERERKVRANT